MTRVLQASEFVLDLLDQNEAFLTSLPEGAYAARVEAVGGSIGSHVRHSLEHLDGLLTGALEGEVYFERRLRNPLVAEHPRAGLDELRRLRAALTTASTPGFSEKPLGARSSLSGRLEESFAYPSCVGRELTYVGLHFVHHMALMAVVSRLLGVPVPENFGKAPATRIYEAWTAV